MVQGQTNQMKGTPVIYMHVIYSYNSHFDWLASTPFCRKHPVSVVNVGLEIVHAKTVSNKGCASFAWVSHTDCCKCLDYSIVVMLCWYARVNITTRLTLLDLDPSPSIIIILYHRRQLLQNARMWKQNVIQYPGETISILDIVGQ